MLPRDDIPAASGGFLPRSGRQASDRINRSWAKRTIDILGSGVALVGLSPFLLLIAILIRLDSPGPVIYRQRRYGRGGTFDILKFRTMTASASQEAFQQARRNDNRVTRIGRLLRRTNIDELPQLINVLIGQMSLIGPRPHPVALDDEFIREIPDLMRRYTVRPGISGWAQVNGCRGETADVAQMTARIEYDLDYIERWSIRLDMTIVFRTLFDGKAFENAR
jgi:exopolysaccharide biosynthesis polyprenyl glycosylphosphotransferase